MIGSRFFTEKIIGWGFVTNILIGLNEIRVLMTEVKLISNLKAWQNLNMFCLKKSKFYDYVPIYSIEIIHGVVGHLIE